MYSDWLIDKLRCPESLTPLKLIGNSFESREKVYKVKNDILSIVYPDEISGDDEKYNRFYNLLAPLYDLNERVMGKLLTGVDMIRGRKQNISLLGLRPGMRILEVSPGPGYFSAKVAQVMPEGKLFLADIQQEMLDYAKKRLTRKNIINVEYHLCNGTSLPFNDNTFDVIFMVTVLGEIENKKEYIREFNRVLRKNGVLSISEQAGDPDKMEIAEIKNLLYDSGFKFDILYGTNKNFTINFRNEK